MEEAGQLHSVKLCLERETWLLASRLGMLGSRLPLVFTSPDGTFERLRLAITVCSASAEN